MLLTPNMQVNKITDITIQILEENNIQAMILDVDNTLIDLNREPLEGLKEWVDKMKQNGIKFCIASNSLKKDKIEKIAKMLDIPYVHFSVKPTKIGLKKAKKILGVENNENIAEVGDQLFTDVLGTNRMKMFSILTEPLCEEKVKINNLKKKKKKRVLKSQKSKVKENGKTC